MIMSSGGFGGLMVTRGDYVMFVVSTTVSKVIIEKMYDKVLR